MFDEKIYYETFSVVHAPDNTLAEIVKKTQQNNVSYIYRAVRVAIICLAIILLPVTTVLAYNHFKSALFFFDGDAELIETSVQIVDEYIAEEQYKIHIDSALSDSYSTIIGLSVDAITKDAWNNMNRNDFDIRDILSFDFGRADASLVSMTVKSADIPDDESVRAFAIRFDGVGAPNTIKVSLKDYEKSAIEICIDNPIETLSVAALSDYKQGDYFISSCELSATQITYEIEFDESVQGDKIVEIYFRKADGSLITLQQLAGNKTEMKLWHEGNINQNTYRYTQPFLSVINPLSIVGVVMNGVEYSFLDGNYLTEVDIPKTIRPFLSPFVERDDIFYVSADDVCEKMGATIENTAGKYTISYLNNSLIFSLENKNINVSGEERSMDCMAMVEKGELLIPSEYVDCLGARIMMYYPERGNVLAPKEWLIIP